MLLTIYDKNGNKRADIAAGDSSTQDKEVQGDNVLTLSFTYYEYVELDVNDYTEFMGERYRLMEKYQPKQNNEGSWQYDVKLYGVESLIKRFLVLETTDGNAEPVFTLTAPPREHVAMIVKCVNDGLDHTTDWKVGQVDGTDNITIDYEGKYCDEALKEIAEAVGGQSEWWIEGQTVNVCRCEHGEEITLGYGKGLTSLERDTSNTAKFYTRLFPIGSTRNIDPEKYGASRLMLPGKKKYVELHTDEYGIHDHYEQEAFSGIYPRRTGTVSSVRSKETTDEDGNKFTIYYFKDNGLDFDPNDYELAGETKRVSFQTGELAGLGESDGHYFEVNYDSKAREFEVITIWPYDDDTQLPSGRLIPKAGDTYILWNIRMPDPYYAAAEEEFAKAVEEYNREHWQDISVYKAPTDYVWIGENGADLYVGRRVRLESAKYFPENGYRSSRITRISRKVNLPEQMDLEISDALQQGALDKVNDSIGELKSYTKQKTGEASLPDIIRTWDNTLPTDTNLFSARRSQREFLSKKKRDKAQERIDFLKGIGLGEEYEIDGNGNATLLTAVIRELLRSAKFVDGMTGEGWQMWIDRLTGLSNLTIDKVTVRQSLVALELLIEKVRSIGGQFVVSAANGRIKTATKQGDNWHITFEQANMFVAHDLIRCATFTGTKMKAYWVEVASTDADGIIVPAGEFGSAVPEEGDECVLMGNTENKLRQNLISIAATEDGQPRVDVLDGVKEKNFNGCLRCRFGNLDGIKDDYFPKDNQPRGNGLYGDNVFLHGTFILMTGEDILTRFEITEGKIASAVEGLRQDIREEQSYLDNTSFSNGMEKWQTGKSAAFLTLGGRWIWANAGPLSTKPKGYAEVRLDGTMHYAYIRNSYIMQKHEDFRTIPDYKQTNSKGERLAGVVYLSFRYKVVEAGRLTISFENADKTGFENFNMFGYDEELEPTGTYKTFNLDGLWNGTGDFKIAFTGLIYIQLLVFSTNKADALTYKYKTLFEQSDRLVKISAAVYDKDENALKETGLVVAPEGSGIYARDANGTTGFIGVSVEEADEHGNTRSVIKLTGDQIQLEGSVTANGKFKINTDGSIEATDGKFTGEINATKGYIGGFIIGSGHIGTASVTTDADGKITVTEATDGLFLYNNMIGFNARNRQAILGTWNNLGQPMLMRLTDTAKDDGYAYSFLPKYGIVFNIDNSLSGNFAFAGKGTGVLKGMVCGYSVKELAQSQSAVTIMSVMECSHIIVTGSGIGVGLPTRTSVRNALNTSGDFCLPVHVAASHGVGSPVELYGRTDQVQGMNTSEYPEIIGTGSSVHPLIQITEGRCYEFLLVGLGNTYSAYIISSNY